MLNDSKIRIWPTKSNTALAMRTCFSLLLFFALCVGIPVFSQAQTAKASPSKKLTRSELVLEAEKLLAERGYWIKKVDTVWDSSTYHAVTAFQKVEGRKRTGKLNQNELDAIRQSRRPLSVFIGDAHIEIDLERQVLFLVDANDIVTHILPVSTGNDKVYYENGVRQIAHTPRGTFTITRQIKGTRIAPLGVLYHPSYFYGGVAIHGSGSIPFYPASHGCVRIPRFAAAEFSDLVYLGMRVILYESAKKARDGG